MGLSLQRGGGEIPSRINALKSEEWSVLVTRWVWCPFHSIQILCRGVRTQEHQLKVLNLQDSKISWNEAQIL